MKKKQLGIILAVVMLACVMLLGTVSVSAAQIDLKQQLATGTCAGGEGGLMARQGKIIDSKVSDTIGRTVIPITKDQIDSIENNIIVVATDGYQDFEVSLDCAYTWFYNVEDGEPVVYNAEDMDYAAFLIIDNNGKGGTITGFGYYRLYADSKDSEDNFLFDTIYQDPNIKYIDVPTAKTGLTYNGEMQTGVIEGEGYTLSGTTSAKDVGNYTATATLKSGYFWKDGSNENKTIDWSIAEPPTKIGWPYPAYYYYDGQEHVWYDEEDTDAEHIEVVSGTASAIEVGEYTVTVKPKDGYCWADGGQYEWLVDWSIEAYEEE